MRQVFGILNPGTSADGRSVFARVPLSETSIVALQCVHGPDTFPVTGSTSTIPKRTRRPPSADTPPTDLRQCGHRIVAMISRPEAPARSLRIEPGGSS